METDSYTDDYKTDFVPLAYLDDYSNPSSPESFLSNFLYNNLHQFFHSVPLPQTELKLLDFGCGPVIANVISASQYVSDIVQAEYTPQGRVLLEQWLKRDPSFTFDWSPHFKYIVQTLEGRSEAEVKEREESLRQKIKAIVPCDITQDPPISQEYAGPYDILVCCCVLGGTAKTLHDYEEQLKRLYSLIKPGGYLLFAVPTAPIENESCNHFYLIDKKKFTVFWLSVRRLSPLLEEIGFTVIDTKSKDNPILEGAKITFFSAKKN